MDDGRYRLWKNTVEVKGKTYYLDHFLCEKHLNVYMRRVKFA